MEISIADEGGRRFWIEQFGHSKSVGWSIFIEYFEVSTREALHTNTYFLIYLRMILGSSTLGRIFARIRITSWYQKHFVSSRYASLH